MSEHRNNETEIKPLRQYTPEEKRANLLKLADALDNMPPPDVRFDMSDYAELGLRAATCGAVGCAIGVASIVIAPRELVLTRYFVASLPESENNPRSYFESWEAYARRVLGHDTYNSYAGTWMFDAAWARRDNTPKGAAARIRWYVFNGLPEDWRGQMYGAIPLCYEVEA